MHRNDRMLTVLVILTRPMYLEAFLFFFSSRRRHTRFDCDWSSDVCSSDLCATNWPLESQQCIGVLPRDIRMLEKCQTHWRAVDVCRLLTNHCRRCREDSREIGRASCRERV